MMGFDLPKGMLSYYLDCQSKTFYLADVLKKQNKTKKQLSEFQYSEVSFCDTY